MVVVDIGPKAGIGLSPQLVPFSERTVCRLKAITTTGPGVHFDYIVVFLDAPEVGFGKACFGAFLRLEEPKIYTIEVEVIVAAAGVGLAHVALGIAVEDVAIIGAQMGHLRPLVPTVLLRGTQIDFIELIDAFVAEQWILQFSCAVLVSEEQAEPMFRVPPLTTVTAADSHAGIYLESLAAVRVDEFDGGGPFPSGSLLCGVRVDARVGMHPIVQIRHE